MVIIQGAESGPIKTAPLHYFAYSTKIDVVLLSQTSCRPYYQMLQGMGLHYLGLHEFTPNGQQPQHCREV